MRDWRRWISSGRRLGRTACLSRDQPGRLAELTDLRDELQAEAGHLEAQYPQEKALAQQIMTLRQEGTDSSELQQQLRTHQGFARCWRWMWTPAPSPRWWRTGPASRSLPCSGTSKRPAQYGTGALENRVVGQSPALCAIAQRLRAAKTGLTPESGPEGYSC